MIANLAVTYRCSSRCRTCNIWQLSGTEGDELSLEEIRTIFNINREFLRDVRSIQITGGEPFLREDLPSIVSIIHGQLPRCTFWIPTNGMHPANVESATRQMLDILGRRGLGISVSIDGIDKTHDTMRGIRGSYSKALETLRKLSSMRGQYPELMLTVGITLTPENYTELGEVFNLVRGHRADLSFRPVNFSSIYYRNVGDSYNLSDAPDELLVTIRNIGRDLVKRRGLLGSVPTLRYMQGTLDYIRSTEKRKLRCTAATESFFLDPVGDVYPCIIMDLKMGNVREQSLEEIWRSERAKEARLRIRKGLCPGCWVECETFRDIYRDRLGLASTLLRAILHPTTLGIN